MGGEPLTPSPAGYAHREPTQPPDWHGLVVWDVFLNALATGLFLVAALGELALPGELAPVAAWAYPLALVLLVTDLLCLVLDLGDPLRFHHMLRVFKPSSPMSLGTWCLTAFSLPLTAVVGLDLLRSLVVLPDAVGVRTALLVVGLPFAFGSAAYKGVLFSTTAQPGWRDARWLGAYHLSGAFVAGAAVLLALSAAVGGQASPVLRLLLIAFLLAHLVPAGLLLAELRPALAARHPARVLGRDAALVGLVGVVLPITLIAGWPGPAACFAAAVCTLAGAWLARRRIVLLPHVHPAGS